MLIFWKARLAILAVPKTGTTALEAALAPAADTAILNPPGLKHCSVRKYRRDLAGFFEQQGRRPLELVAVMREPVSWLGSWYRYRTRPALHEQPNSTSGMGFDRFIEAYLSEPAPDFARVGSQANFLAGGVDHLFAYDQFERCLEFLGARLERTIALSRSNVSPQRTLSLSGPLRDRLERERSADFTLWRDLQRDPDAFRRAP